MWVSKESQAQHWSNACGCKNEKLQGPGLILGQKHVVVDHRNPQSLDFVLQKLCCCFFLFLFWEIERVEAFQQCLTVLFPLILT